MGKVLIILFCQFFCTFVSAQEVPYLLTKEKTIRDVYCKDYSNSLSASIPFENNWGNASILRNIQQNNKLIIENQFPNNKLLNYSIIHQWRNLNLYGIGNRTNMIGLVDKQNAEVGVTYSSDKLFFSVGLIASVYNFNSLSTMYDYSTIQNQFGISGALSYDFNENVSATVYGRYVTNSFYHSMASFPYIATSSYGGYIMLYNGKCGIDLGVNNYYDAFSGSWQTNPIVRPTYKIGKVKMSFDMGPLMKEGILRLMNKRRVDGPIILPSRYKR